MHREPEVLEAEAQVEECLDCRARITSKELAPLHSMKNCILQNACSTSQKIDADLGKSDRMRIARLMNSPAKGLKKMMTKVQWLCWELHDNWVAHGAAEVFIDFAEELKHTETNSLCSVH